MQDLGLSCKNWKDLIWNPCWATLGKGLNFSVAVLSYEKMKLPLPPLMKSSKGSKSHTMGVRKQQAGYGVALEGRQLRFTGGFHGFRAAPWTPFLLSPQGCPDALLLSSLSQQAVSKPQSSS